MNAWEKVLPKPRSKFLKVKCPDCGNEQVVFSHVTNLVHCNVCGAVLAKPSGGKTIAKGEIVSAVE